MRLVLIGGFQGWLLGGGSFLCGFGGSLGFTLATAHFTRVVRRAAVRQPDGGRLYCGWGFDRCRFDDHGCRLGHCFWLSFDYRCGLLGNRSRFDNGRGLFDFTGFHGWGFHWRFSSHGFGNHGRLDNRCRFDGGLRSDFDHRLGGCLDHGHWLADRLLDRRCYGHFLSLGDSFDLLYLFNLLDGLGGFAVVSFCCGGDFSGGALGLLVGLGFGVGADVAGGNSGSHCQAGGQFGTQLGGLVLLWLLFAAFFFAVDQLAIGVALALTTVAATALTTRAAARALAIGGFLLVLQQLIVWQLLFGQLGSLFGRFFCGTWLTLFAWWFLLFSVNQLCGRIL